MSVLSSFNLDNSCYISYALLADYIYDVDDLSNEEFSDSKIDILFSVMILVLN
jgi:hypothetical protein